MRGAQIKEAIDLHGIPDQSEKLSACEHILLLNLILKLFF